MKLKALGVHFYRFGFICAPVPVIIVYLGIYVEVGQEGLRVILIIDVHEAGFKILDNVYLILVSLAWRASIFFLW